MNTDERLKQARKQLDAVQKEIRRLRRVKADLNAAKGENAEATALHKLMQSKAIKDRNRRNRVCDQSEADVKAFTKKLDRIGKRLNRGK